MQRRNKYRICYLTNSFISNYLILIKCVKHFVKFNRIKKFKQYHIINILKIYYLVDCDLKLTRLLMY